MVNLHFIGSLGIENFGMMRSLFQITHEILVSGFEWRLNNELYNLREKG